MFLMWSSDICRLIVCWRISGLLLRRTFGNNNIGIYWAWISQIKVFKVYWACVVFVPLSVGPRGPTLETPPSTSSCLVAVAAQRIMENRHDYAHMLMTVHRQK